MICCVTIPLFLHTMLYHISEPAYLMPTRSVILIVHNFFTGYLVFGAQTSIIYNYKRNNWMRWDLPCIKWLLSGIQSLTFCILRRDFKLQSLLLSTSFSGLRPQILPTFPMMCYSYVTVLISKLSQIKEVQGAFPGVQSKRKKKGW